MQTLPCDPRTGLFRPQVWERWLRHDPVRTAAAHTERLRALRLLYLETGRRDDYHMHWGVRALHATLQELGIAHEYQEHDGGHHGIEHRFTTSLARLGRVWDTAAVTTEGADMCGIAGFIPLGAPRERQWLAALGTTMTGAMAHRGESAGAPWVAPSGAAMLACVRLAVQDRTGAGDQPMADPDGRLVLVNNGEVYASRAPLARHGHGVPTATPNSSCNRSAGPPTKRPY